MGQQQLTLGQVADEFGVHLWQVQRVYERNMVPAENVHRFGRWRGVSTNELPVIREALERAGYLSINGPAIGG